MHGAPPPGTFIAPRGGSAAPAMAANASTGSSSAAITMPPVRLLSILGATRPPGDVAGRRGEPNTGHAESPAGARDRLEGVRKKAANRGLRVGGCRFTVDELQLKA